MLVKTRDFGDVEVKQQDIITFVQPIFGFDGFKTFVLLRQDDPDIHFSWLQSTEDASVCFLTADPREILDNYEVSVKREEAEQLGGGGLLYLVLAAIRDPIDQSTVNLKSPIALNPQTGRAMQVILDADYPIRHLLIPPKEDA